MKGILILLFLFSASAYSQKYKYIELSGALTTSSYNESARLSFGYALGAGYKFSKFSAGLDLEVLQEIQHEKNKIGVHADLRFYLPHKNESLDLYFLITPGYSFYNPPVSYDGDYNYQLKDGAFLGGGIGIRSRIYSLLYFFLTITDNAQWYKTSETETATGTVVNSLSSKYENLKLNVGLHLRFKK